MSKSKKVTVGYSYFAGMHLALCHSADKIKKIMVGERMAWEGSVAANSQIYVNQPELFGGKKREGGVVGYVDIEFGAAAQARNSYLESKLGANVPAHRGIVGLVLRQPMLSQNNPYVKAWSVEVERIPAQAWYPLKATLLDGTYSDANPAHIVYDVLTNQQWGLGVAPADIDDASFMAAADTLYAESFGLSLLWNQTSNIIDFLSLVMYHVDGTVFANHRTGLFEFKLFRGDYDAALLQGFDASSIISVEKFKRLAPGEMANTVVLKWIDRNNKQQAETVHDIAGISAVGQEVAATLDMAGIAKGNLAITVAMRELLKVSRPTASLTIICTRAASGVTIGDVIKITMDEYNLYQVPMRVTNVSYGTLGDGKIRLDMIEDAYAYPAYTAANYQGSLWETPYTLPADAPYRVRMEAPYWTIVHEVTTESATLLAELDPDGGALMAGAGGVSSDTINYTIWTRQGVADYTDQGTGNVTPTGTLLASMNKSQTSFVIQNHSRLDMAEASEWAVINPGAANEELVAIKTIDVGGGTITVARAVLDTTPWEHAAGERVWFLENAHWIDDQEYLIGEVVNVKTLPTTSLGTLAIADATQDSFTFAARMIRPYAPGNVKINTVAYPASVTGDLAITWAHRDRTLQTAYMVEQTEASIGPEAGTTYTIRIYNAQTAGALIRTYTGLTGTSQAYTVAQATTDNAGIAPTNLRVEIEAVRGGYASHQFQRRAFAWV